MSSSQQPSLQAGLENDAVGSSTSIPAQADNAATIDAIEQPIASKEADEPAPSAVEELDIPAPTAKTDTAITSTTTASELPPLAPAEADAPPKQDTTISAATNPSTTTDSHTPSNDMEPPSTAPQGSAAENIEVTQPETVADNAAQPPLEAVQPPQAITTPLSSAETQTTAVEQPTASSALHEHQDDVVMAPVQAESDKPSSPTRTQSVQANEVKPLTEEQPIPTATNAEDAKVGLTKVEPASNLEVDATPTEGNAPIGEHVEAKLPGLSTKSPRRSPPANDPALQGAEVAASAATDPSQPSRPVSSIGERDASATVPEKRTERDNAERTQDKESRTREREKRKEQERAEREREEQERERLREAERDREMMITRENEEARLIWLSLPGNDHPQYYTDTDSDSCYGASGALGVDLSDEEDKDLNPPFPSTQQEYYPAPSYSAQSYNSSFQARSYNDAVHAQSVSTKRKRLPAVVTAERRVAPTSTPLNSKAGSSATPMISIDDFHVPDSSIRGEASDHGFLSRVERPFVPGASPFSAPRFEDEYTSDSGEDAERVAGERKRRHGNRNGNRGNKLSRSKGARWVRRGKLGGWTEMRMDKELGDRIRHRVEAMQKDNVRALLSAVPAEDRQLLSQLAELETSAETSTTVLRDARGRMLPSDLSEAARIDAQFGLGPGATVDSGGLDHAAADEDGHLTSTALAPTLLKPAVTARQLLTSHTLRHTFRNPHIGALGKTALDLIESEVVLGRAVGRCWGSMERGGWNEDPEPKSLEERDGSGEQGPDAMDLEMERDQNGHRYAQENDSEAMFGTVVDNPALSHLDDLFVTKGGLAIPRLDEMGQPIFVSDGQEESAEPVIETTLLPAPEQRSIVLAALECLHDLAADSREYVERLEEVRSRLAAVKRTRAQVWYAVRQWALDTDLASTDSHIVHHHTAPISVASTASPRKRK